MTLYHSLRSMGLLGKERPVRRLAVLVVLVAIKGPVVNRQWCSAARGGSLSGGFALAFGTRYMVFLYCLHT